DSTISPCTTAVTGSRNTAVATTSTLTLANASANAPLLHRSVNATPVATIAASPSGSGTYPPLTFSASGSERMRLLATAPQLIMGATSSDVSNLGTSPGVIAVGAGGLAVAGASTNASVLFVGYVSGGTAMVVDSEKTGTGTVLPL